MNTNKDPLINDFSAGTLTINPGNLHPNPSTPSTTERINSSLGVSMSFAITGGTADLLVVNSNNYDGGASMYNSFGLTGLAGVTSVSWTITYTEPVAGRNDAGQFTNLSSRPMGAALGLVTAGAGLGLTSFNVEMSLGGVYSAPTPDGVFIAGVPMGAEPFASAEWDSVSGGDTTFVSADGFNGLIQVAGVEDPDFLLVRGYNYDGSGTLNSNDVQQVYITTMTWTITPNSGTFAAGTEFTLSLDGQQHANWDAVPEPSVLVLAGGAGLFGLLMRRRRARQAA